jgi:hypothetical protein
MEKNTCKDYASFAEQIFIENISPSTKDIEFHVFRDHLLTLRRK